MYDRHQHFLPEKMPPLGSQQHGACHQKKDKIEQGRWNILVMHNEFAL